MAEGFNLELTQNRYTLALKAEMDSYAGKLKAAVVGMLGSGMSDNEIIETLKKDLYSGGPIFGGLKNQFGSIIGGAINDYGQTGLSEIADDEELTWLTTSTKPCKDCLPRHGMTKTYKEWVAIGLPRSGWSVCGYNCLCVLIPGNSIPDIEDFGGPVEAVTIREVRKEVRERMDTDLEFQDRVIEFRTKREMKNDPQLFVKYKKDPEYKAKIDGIVTRKYQAAKAKKEAELLRQRLLKEGLGIDGAQVFGDTLTKVEGVRLGGSTGAFMVQDLNGQRWIMKNYSRNIKRVQNEYIANRLYKELGVKVPDGRIAQFDGDLCFASKVLDGVEEMGSGHVGFVADTAAAKKGFVVDSWLANWDVAGLSYDNILLKPGSKTQIYRIDQGGALIFRAQGGAKNLTREVTELKTLRDPGMNRASAELFKHVTDEEIAVGIQTVRNKYKKIDVADIIKSSGIDDITGKEISDLLASRMNYLWEWRKEVLRKKKGGPASGTFVVFNDPANPHAIDTPNALRSNSVSTWNKLSASEKAAFKGYTGSGYRNMNRNAVNGIGEPGLDTGLTKFDRYNGRIGRGIQYWDPKLEEDFKKWKSGEWGYVEWKAYSSTSLSTGVFRKDFNVIILNKGHHPGAFVDSFSTCKGEQEYLLGRNAKFHVIGWDEKGNKKFLLVEEVKDSSMIPERQGPPPRVDAREEFQKFRDEVQSRGGL
jgi:hypothetical protein